MHAPCARAFGPTGILRKTHRPAKSLIRPDKCSTIKPRAIRWKNAESQPWKNCTVVCPCALLLGVKEGTIQLAWHMQISVNLSICFLNLVLCTVCNIGKTVWYALAGKMLRFYCSNIMSLSINVIKTGIDS